MLVNAVKYVFYRKINVKFNILTPPHKNVLESFFSIYVPDYSGIPILQDRISSLKFLKKTLETRRSC